MATLRRGASGSRPAARAGQPGILLDSESPYGSRRVVVEYDGATTAAYLHDADTIVGAAWIANHQQAPASTDLSRLDAGRAPLMPAGHTKHPGGRPPLDARALRRHPGLVRHVPGHARVQPGRHGPEPVRLVPR
jgi:hypothetical protein